MGFRGDFGDLLADILQVTASLDPTCDCLEFLASPRRRRHFCEAKFSSTHTRPGAGGWTPPNTSSSRASLASILTNCCSKRKKKSGGVANQHRAELQTASLVGGPCEIASCQRQRA
jgi:hypothetical protein